MEQGISHPYRTEARNVSHLTGMEIVQAQMEELRDQLDTLKIGETHRGQSKDISLVAGIMEWICESKGRGILCKCF
jgi:hypothetical protein